MSAVLEESVVGLQNNKNLVAADVRPDYVATGQYRWDPLQYQDDLGVTLDVARKLALADRDAWVKQMRKLHSDITEMHAWALPNQLRQYRSMGVEDGRVRSVFYVTVRRKRGS